LNALVAAGLVIGVGASPAEVFSALSHLKGVPGRLELVSRTPAGAPVYVDYAHTPDALLTVLEALRPHVRGRIHLVFGCGGDRDRGKRPQMGRVAAAHADRLIVTDDNPRGEDPAAIRKEVIAAAPTAIEIADRKAAIEAALAALAGDDLLVVAGKGHETGQIIGRHVVPFSDAETVRKAIAAMETVS
jgi:UDP-N-acetylmuramoyl-L-alanyl-D-glutamate--2,6-diaminopimelate ligase